MKSLRRGKSAKLLAEINVVPFIDVMLVLLVIFMITTPLLTSGVQVNLPRQHYGTNIGKQQNPIVVTVDSKGKYYINIAAKPDQAIDVNELHRLISNELNKINTHLSPIEVLVRGDKETNYGTIMDAMVLLKDMGINTLGLITESNQARNK